MKLQQFERNQKSPNDSDLLTYHVFNNDVTARINNDLPPLRPDYNKMKSSDFFLKDFFPAFRKGQAKLRQVRIGCLIIKQIGKGKADSTILDVSKVNLSKVLYIYDGTDFGAFDTSYLKKNEEQLALGNMNTGNSILIPLYVTNLFDRDDKSGNPMGWEVITNTAYVPTVLRYSDKGKKVDINLNKVLGRPINID
jgi:hypothetical protein